MNSSINKRLRGQFFTVVNPFLNDVFMEWWNQIPKNSRNRVLEPFAGANNIVEMIGSRHKDRMGML